MKPIQDELQVHKNHREEIRQTVEADPFAKSLGIQLIAFDAGFAEARLTVEKHMVNAHGTVHGAVLYALADYVFAVACNSYGKTSLGLSTTIQFIRTAEVGDVILARATEVQRNVRTGFYRIDVFHGETLVATMDAVAYRKNQHFIAFDVEDES